jgi:hypothetical protein
MNTTTAPKSSRLATRLPESLFQSDHFDDIPTRLFEIRNFLPLDILEVLAKSCRTLDTQNRIHERSKKTFL